MNPIEMNPLLDFSGLPRFNELTPSHVSFAIDRLLAEGRLVVATITDDAVAAKWDAFVEPLEDATERLARAWGQVEHLHAVLDSPDLRAAYNANLPKVTQFWTELGQNQRLFDKYRALANSAEFKSLTAARTRLIENALRDFRLSGAELAAELKPRYAEIQDELASLVSLCLGARFSAGDVSREFRPAGDPRGRRTPSERR